MLLAKAIGYDYKGANTWCKIIDSPSSSVAVTIYSITKT